MPARRPPTDVHLVDFLGAVFAVLALKGRIHWSGEPGVLDRALRETLKQLKPVAEKMRVRPRFRIAPDALGRPTSNLRRALARLERDAVLQVANGNLDVLLTPAQAYVELEATPFPLEFAERAAKAFLKRHAVARIGHARSASKSQRNKRVVPSDNPLITPSRPGGSPPRPRP